VVHVEAEEIGLPVSGNGLVLPCGASGRWEKIEQCQYSSGIPVRISLKFQRQNTCFAFIDGKFE